MLARTTYLRWIGVLHATIHELHNKKMDGVLFNFDFDNVQYQSYGMQMAQFCL
jgi:hypothetical protein